MGKRITFRKPSEGSLQGMKRGLVKKELRSIKVKKCWIYEIY